MAKVQVASQSVRSRNGNHGNPQRKCVQHTFIDKRNQDHSLNSSVRNEQWLKKTNLRIPWRRYSWEKYLSVGVHIISFLILLRMILLETESYRQHPTATTVENEMYPIQKIDFPGVGICSMNVINRKTATEMAIRLWSKEEVHDVTNITFDKLTNLMQYFGHLYLFETWENETGDIMLLHEILKAYHETYDIEYIMQFLTPDCSSFLHRCDWDGVNRLCNDLFVTRKTQDGFCCTFNYVRWTDSFNTERKTDFPMLVERSQVTGTDYGLWVLMDPELEDYVYSILPGQGFKVLIYTATDYPDAASGGLKEIILSPQTESFLKLTAISFYSSPNVMKYRSRERQCFFNTELDEIYKGSYSYSECMLFCRIRDMMERCGCIPFFYPKPNDAGSVKTCNLADLECLQRFKYKWWRLKPMELKWTENLLPNDEDDVVTEDSLICDCLPSCDNVDYQVFKTASKIHQPEIIWTSVSDKNKTNKRIVLNVSFGSTSAIRLRQAEMFHWYELMSTYGGLYGLFLGISIITPIELIYLLCLRLHGWLRKKKLPKTRPLPSNVELNFCQQPIYWKEITLPNRRY